MAGILPFGAVFIELFFIFTAIWENQFYYLFGFLFLVFIILIISCSQISIVMVYFQLCGEVSKSCMQLGSNNFFAGLPLVVAKFYSIWGFSLAYLGLFVVLFRNEIRNNRIYSHFTLLRIYNTNGFDILVTYRNYRIFCGLCFRKKDLLSCKN